MKISKHILVITLLLFFYTLNGFTQTQTTNETLSTQETILNGNTDSQNDTAETQINIPANTKIKKDALKLYSSGKYKESIQVCQEEIQEDSQHIDSYVVMCWSLLANKEYSEAEYWATEALKISKYDQRVIESLAEAKYYLGKNDESLKLFQEYISLVPVNGSHIGDAYYFMGEIYIRKGMYDHADISFSHSVRTDPLYDYWWTRLGYAREMAGYYSSSLAAYEKALQLNSAQPDAIRGINRVKSKLQ